MSKEDTESLARAGFSIAADYRLNPSSELERVYRSNYLQFETHLPAGICFPLEINAEGYIRQCIVVWTENIEKISVLLITPQGASNLLSVHSDVYTNDDKPGESSSLLASVFAGTNLYVPGFVNTNDGRVTKGSREVVLNNFDIMRGRGRVVRLVFDSRSRSEPASEPTELQKQVRVRALYPGSPNPSVNVDKKGFEGNRAVLLRSGLWELLPPRHLRQ